MALSAGVLTSADLQNISRQIYLLMMERYPFELEAFNQKSNGAVVLVDGDVRGPYTDRFLWDSAAGVWRHRDITSATTLSAVKLTERAERDVTVALTSDRLAIDLDAFWREGRTESQAIENFSDAAGRDLVNLLFDNAIAALVATLSKAAPSTATWVYDISGLTNKTLKQGTEENGFDLRFGPSYRKEIAAAIYSPKGWNQISHDLRTTLGVVTETGVRYHTEAAGNIPGRAFASLSVDNAGLEETAPGTPVNGKYYSMYLKRNAIRVTIDEFAPPMVQEEKMQERGPELSIRLMARCKIQVPGFSWNDTAGGTNPTLTSVGTAANWTTKANNDRQLPGFMILHDGTRQTVVT